MKIHYFIATALATVLISSISSATTISFQGTGLSFKAPPGMHKTPAGTALIDDAGETTIVFASTPGKSNFENNPTLMKIYANRPESIMTPHITGKLYKRTRAHDGGAWDGWYLSVPRGDKNLTVLVSYTGNSKEFFEQLREYLLTLKWDDTQSDPELAMGFSLSPEGLNAVSNSFGALVYNKSGQLGSTGPQISAQLLPMPIQKTDQLFLKGCNASIFGSAFFGKPYEGPNLREHNGVRLCDAWSKLHTGESHYIAFARLPTGALISISGSAPSAQFEHFLPIFRKAVLELKLFKHEHPKNEMANR